MAYIRFDLAQFLRYLLVQRYTRYSGVLHSTEAFFLPKLVIRTDSQMLYIHFNDKEGWYFLRISQNIYGKRTNR